jgi:hypothetical protein
LTWVVQPGFASDAAARGGALFWERLVLVLQPEMPSE